MFIVTTNDFGQGALTPLGQTVQFVAIIISIVFFIACAVSFFAFLASALNDKQKFGRTLISKKRFVSMMEQMVNAKSEEEELSRPYAKAKLDRFSRIRVKFINMLLLVFAIFTFVLSTLMGMGNGQEYMMLMQSPYVLAGMLAYTIFAIWVTSKQKNTNERAEKLTQAAAAMGISNIEGFLPPTRQVLSVANTFGAVLGFIAPVFGTFWYMAATSVAKPIIYLYPEKKTNIAVKLGKPESLTCSYPKYESEWKVTAEPTGKLTDNKTGRELYALYYENDSSVDFRMTDEGFCVRGKDSASFLEGKLEQFGFTPREAEEFIVYWLPKLEASDYNYIRFASEEEIEQNMPLLFSEQPDTLIRVIMVFKALDKPVIVCEQIIDTPTREGFVVVEWGGTEIK